MPRDDVEPAELAALLAAIVGEQDPGDDDLAELSHLRARRALFEAAAEACTARMAVVAARLNDHGVSFARIGEHIGRSASGGQKLVEQGRAAR